MKITHCLFVAAVTCFMPHTAPAQVVINEFMYDDTGAADDREFVELYNAGAGEVDLSGWVLGGYDVTTTNQSTTLPGGATIAPGGFYVVADAGTLNVNHVVAAGFLENDNEVIALRDASGTLVDAVACETNKGVGFVAAGVAGVPEDSADVGAQVGPGIFGNHQGIDLAGTPLNASVSLGRFVDGRDTNNNGRDFGLRPATPGTTNAPGGTMTLFTPPDPALLAPGTALDSMAGSFVPVRVIDPALIDANNLNVISPPHGAGTKAYVGWDPSGGGNGNTSLAVFAGRTAGFSIQAFLDTTNLPVQFNASNVQFRGSEITLYGIGGGDALTNLTDLDGSIGIGAGTLPTTDTANGFTGVAWIYERVAADPVSGLVSEKLHLVDANDGGDSDLAGNTPLDWQILATYDLSGTDADWYHLSIYIDAAGNGIAIYDGQSTLFTVPGMHSSAFNIGYRENLQQGADGTPDGLIRPPTFTFPRAAPLLGDLTFASLTTGSANFSIPASRGQSIGMEYSQTLEAGSWTSLGFFNITGATGTFSDTDTVRLAAPRGFYRAVLR